MVPSKAETDYLGLGSRLSAGPSELLASTAFAEELRAAPILHPLMSRVDQAHVVALDHAGIIDRSTSHLLFQALKEIGEIDARQITWDPKIGDIYNNRDRLLRETVGSLSGWLSTARARRESTTGAWTIATRQRLLSYLRALAELVEAIHGVAAANRSAILPDFTYLQHAHPTTLAHYLTSFTAPIVRDIVRVERAIESFDSCPLGAGSTNGSRHDLDRSLLARLLCFRAVRLHTRDAMWSPDCAIEAAAVLLTASSTIGRLCDELLIWSTSEFGYIEMSDEHCRTSVIMPQKKNPYGLTHVRGVCRQAVGLMTSVVATQNTPTGQPDNRIYSYEALPTALDEITQAIRLLTEIISSMSLRTDTMAISAEHGYTYATELCDLLTLTRGVNNRQAHRIIGASVRAAAESQRDVELADIDTAAHELGIRVDPIDEADFASAIGPTRILQARKTRGGAGPMALEEILEEQSHAASESVTNVSELDCANFQSRSHHLLTTALAIQENLA